MELLLLIITQYLPPGEGTIPIEPGFKGQTFGFTPMSCTVHYVWWGRAFHVQKVVCITIIEHVTCERLMIKQYN